MIARARRVVLTEAMVESMKISMQIHHVALGTNGGSKRGVIVEA